MKEDKKMKESIQKAYAPPYEHVCLIKGSVHFYISCRDIE